VKIVRARKWRKERRMMNYERKRKKQREKRKDKKVILKDD